MEIGCNNNHDHLLGMAGMGSDSIPGPGCLSCADVELLESWGVGFGGHTLPHSSACLRVSSQ